MDGEETFRVAKVLLVQKHSSCSSAPEIDVTGEKLRANNTGNVHHQGPRFVQQRITTTCTLVQRITPKCVEI